MPNAPTRILLLATLLVSSAAIAQEPPPPASGCAAKDEACFTGVSFYAENDLFQRGGIDEDRNYTGGFGFLFGGHFVRSVDAPLRGLDHLTGVSKLHEKWARHSHSLLVFGTAFTPDNLNTRRVVRGDRPYASLIGMSIRRTAVNDADFDTAVSTELAIAMLGTPVARNVQTWIHRRLRAASGESTPYDPLGWHNQISDGGEPTALYRVQVEHRLLGAHGGPQRKHFQVTGGLAGSAGYYTSVNALVNARIGWFSTEFWEFAPAAMRVGAQNADMDKPAKWDVFVFAGGRPQLNLYNALMQGQFRKSVYTVDIKRGTFEWDLGVAAVIRPLRLRLSWNVLAGRTSEFKGARPPRTHTWGSIIATWGIPLPHNP
ncbi:MAG: hypothetical protein QOI24_2980 [Acidobacteriota bacterium]|jgi:hypothetical protein|nr:hypothetical protein [Acidobacteriota bacterium]